jgi:hypothetical protein
MNKRCGEGAVLNGGLIDLSVNCSFGLCPTSELRNHKVTAFRKLDSALIVS